MDLTTLPQFDSNNTTYLYALNVSWVLILVKNEEELLNSIRDEQQLNEKPQVIDGMDQGALETVSRKEHCLRFDEIYSEKH